MKAKELYAQYLIDLEKSDNEIAVCNLFKCMSEEVYSLVKTRNVSSDLGFISILKEQNKKWNAICKLKPSFKRNAFLTLWKLKMPELEEFL